MGDANLATATVTLKHAIVPREIAWLFVRVIPQDSTVNGAGIGSLEMRLLKLVKVRYIYIYI